MSMIYISQAIKYLHIQVFRSSLVFNILYSFEHATLNRIVLLSCLYISHPNKSYSKWTRYHKILSLKKELFSDSHCSDHGGAVFLQQCDDSVDDEGRRWTARTVVVRSFATSWFLHWRCQYLHLCQCPGLLQRYSSMRIHMNLVIVFKNKGTKKKPKHFVMVPLQNVCSKNYVFETKCP